MKETLKNLSQIRTNVLVIDCGNPIAIDIVGDSESPDLIILNGTVETKHFEEAQAKISNGGIIAFTRGDSTLCKTLEQGVELYGDAYKIIADCLKKGEFIRTIKNVLVYVKGLGSDKVTGANDWGISKKKNGLKPIQIYNLKAVLKNSEFKPVEKVDEEPPLLVSTDKTPDADVKAKRTRRTKEQIEADKLAEKGE